MSSTPKFSKASRAQGSLPGFPRLLGGRLCLDYVNTLEKHVRDGPDDYLPTFRAFIEWGQHIRLLSAEDVAATVLWSEAQPAAARQVHAQAMALRDGLTNLFLAIAHGESPPATDLRLVESSWMVRPGALQLRKDDGQYGWQWSEPDQPAEHLLWAICDSAVQVLAHDNLTRLRECPGANDCGSLFLDTSRNGTRQWCSMEGCGSRVKMRRQYARQARTKRAEH